MLKKLPVQQMTPRQIDNIINKYNKRAEAAAKSLGTQSSLYQDYTTLISMLTGGNTRTKSIKTTTGKTEKIIQAKRGKTSTNKILTDMQANPQRQQKILNRLARQKTVREYLQNIKETHYKETYKGKKVSKLSNVELQEYAQQSTDLIRELSSRIDEVYNVIGYNLNDFKTYSIDELQNMVDKINDDYDNPEFFDEPPEAGFNATDIPY